ncbi:Serine carboxypeptidase S28 family protein [Euphorbia peplus]|nr:Serine carboxypeptidase S28 family protein [Euphorbia peplus]
MTFSSFYLLHVFLFLGAICSSALHPRTLSRYHRLRKHAPTSEFSYEDKPNYQTHDYKQTLDHFNYKPESYAKIKQRYILNSKYWGGANMSSPIFVYLGEEGDITDDLKGFIVDLADHFKGLMLFIEHRYYGESMPFGSEDEAFQNSSTLGYLSSEQALADYAEVIVHVKRKLSAEKCPTIALGGSYGGELAAWFRLKYPHIVIGALASSAPILYYDDIIPQNGYHSIVTKDFKETSESCYNTIKKSWSEIDKVAAQPNGLLTLGKGCVKIVSYGLSNTSAWDWQACTEHVSKIGYDYNETMFQSSPFDMKSYTNDCFEVFGINPRPHWITTEFGGHDIKTVLGNFASNIIFSNGLRDPYSIGGILEDISDSVVAIYTKQGAHCLDIVFPTPHDPDWLVGQ